MVDSSIKYSISVDTAEALKAEAVIDTSIKGIVDDFAKADKAVREFEATQKSLGNTINRFGQVLNSSGSVLASNSQEYRKLVATANAANDAAIKQTKTAQGVSNAFKVQKGSLQQVGFQLQDLIVQLQMGTSAFVAIGQQGSQLAGIFGAGGALVGAAIALASVLGGTLYKAFGDTSMSVEDLNKELLKLIETSTLTENQAAALVDSENKSTEEKKKKIKAIDEEIKRLEQQQKIQDEAIKKRKEQDDTESKVYQKLIKASKDTAIALSQERAERDLYDQQIKKSAENIKLYNNLVGEESVTANKKQREEIKAMIETLKIQSETFGMTEKQLALYTATTLHASDAEKKLIAQHYDSINAQKNKAAAIEATHNEIVKMIEADERAAEMERKRAESGAVSFATGVISGGMTESERLAADLQKLEEVRAQSLLSTELYEQAKTSIEEQQVAAREKMRQEEAAADLQRNNMILASGAQMFDAMAGLFANAEGEQSSAYKAMFALSKGFAIAQAGLNLTTAISQASTLPWPTNIPAMAQAAASGAALVGQISSASYGGARQFGGPVSSGSAYRVGEAGPEIFQTNSGKNIMLPGENGKVLSNSQSMDAMGGGNVVVNIENNGAPVEVSSNSQSREGDTRIVNLTLKAVASEINRNQGVVAKALRNSTSTTMKANR